ncbi:MAG: hypothetical protein KDD28_15410 [Phaeodactylibacter sp.]|nr:hypothetical protein [Phaeodactylibacter sp.]
MPNNKAARDAIEKNIAILEQSNAALESFAASLSSLNQFIKALLKKSP